jgi:hypothetical protein
MFERGRAYKLGRLHCVGGPASMQTAALFPHVEDYGRVLSSRHYRRVAGCRAGGAAQAVLYAITQWDREARLRARPIIVSMPAANYAQSLSAIESQLGPALERATFHPATLDAAFDRHAPSAAEPASNRSTPSWERSYCRYSDLTLSAPRG